MRRETKETGPGGWRETSPRTAGWWQLPPITLRHGLAPNIGKPFVELCYLLFPHFFEVALALRVLPFLNM